MIIKIAEDAYFVPSYSGATIVPFQYQGTIAGVSVSDAEIARRLSDLLDNPDLIPQTVVQGSERLIREE